MEIDKVKVGYLRTNCYILKSRTCLIIDPGDEFDKIVEHIGSLQVDAILLTHSHFDHIGCVGPLLDKYNCRLLKRSCLEETEYNINDFKFEVLFTPGHSNDSVTYYFKNNQCMFVGDFIFKESIGRTDLETSSISDMKESIKKIKQYKNVTLYPGHGSNTTLNYELENNVYLRGEL